jgi:hypothetical protein
MVNLRISTLTMVIKTSKFKVMVGMIKAKWQRNLNLTV